MHVIDPGIVQRLVYVLPSRMPNRMAKADQTVLRPTAFLDTNVVVDGRKREAVDVIRRLGEQGLVKLYISPDTLAEHAGRSLGRVKQERYEAMLALKAALPGTQEFLDAWTQRQAIEKTYDDICSSEEDEMEYWDSARLNIALCTFSALVSLATSTPPAFLYAMDERGEITQFEELILKHKISRTDAILLEIAHSQECDYFVSSDERRFLRKAKRATWLRPVLVTPEEFILDPRFASLVRNLHTKKPARRRGSRRRS